MRELMRKLDRHWFAPAPLGDLALVRIFLVGVVLFVFPPGQQQPGPGELWTPLPVLKIMMLPFGEWGVQPQFMLLEAAHLVRWLSGVCALVGLGTRASLLCFAGSNTFLEAHNYSYGEIHHAEGATLLYIALFALSLGPPHARMSADAFLLKMRARAAGWRPPDREVTESELARWPLRVAQWCIALAYISAALSKLGDGGLAWLNGYTLEKHVMGDVMLTDPLLGRWFAALPTIALSAISIATMAFEFFFSLAILYPRLIWLFVLAGLAMHTGIYLTQGVGPFFPLVCTYVVFIESLRMTFPFRHALWARYEGAKARLLRNWPRDGPPRRAPAFPER
jgi:hypothetical protein